MSKNELRQIREAVDALQIAEGSLAALAAARVVRELADALELETVETARKEGLSWSKIGAVYGLTKQGAQQRFRAVLPEGSAQSSGGKSKRVNTANQEDPDK